MAASMFDKCTIVMADPTPWVAKRYNASSVWYSPKYRHLRFLPVGLLASNTIVPINNFYTNFKPTQPLHMLTLASIRRRVGWDTDQPVTLLKIDIEGFEWVDTQVNTSEPITKALKHAENHDTTLLPHLYGSAHQIIIELHSGTPTAWHRVIQQFSRRGYTLGAVTGARMLGRRMALAELTFVQVVS